MGNPLTLCVPKPPLLDLWPRPPPPLNTEAHPSSTDNTAPIWRIL